MKDEIKNNIKKILESKNFKTLIYTLGILFIVLMIFQAGMLAGYKKASFGRNWGDNYERNFGFPPDGSRMMGGEFGGLGNFPNAHGAIGKIIKLELPTMIVLDEKDNTEKVVVVNDKTEIRLMRDVTTPEKLKLDDHIIIIGEPNSSGQIEARLIRFLPAPLPVPIINPNQ
jgi:hypothetical protein